MAYCFYRNRNKYKMPKKKEQIYSKEKVSIDDLKLKKVQFNINVKVIFIPRVRSQDSLTRDLLWYNYDELNKFYNDRKREKIFMEMQQNTLKLTKNKSEPNIIQYYEKKIYKRLRSNTV
jgi:hypothetical protein